MESRGTIPSVAMYILVAVTSPIEFLIPERYIRIDSGVILCILHQAEGVSPIDEKNSLRVIDAKLTPVWIIVKKKQTHV
jgi:hypothetical protein